MFQLNFSTRSFFDFEELKRTARSLPCPCSRWKWTR